MSLIPVYDNDGKEHMKEPVDARECVDIMGWSLTKPAEELKPEPEAEPKPALNIGNKNHFNPKK